MSEENINKRVNLIVLVGLIFLIFYLPLDFGGHISSFVGLRPVTILYCVSFLMMGLFLLTFQKTPKSLTVLKWPLLGFFLFCSLSSLFSVCPYYSLLEEAKFLAYFFLFFLALNIAKIPRYLNILVNSIIASGLLVTLAGMFIFLLTNYCNIPSRFYATFYQADVCAGFLVLVIPLALSLFLSDKLKSLDFFYSFSAILMILGLILTGSRGGWLALIIVLPFIFWQKRYLSKKIIFYKSLILIVIILAIATIAGPVLNKYYSSRTESVTKLPKVTEFVSEGVTSLALDKTYSVKARLCFWKSAFKIFLDHPLLGTGLKTFGRFHSQYQVDLRFFSKFPHNFYLSLLVEAGLFTFLTFLLILGILAKRFKEALKSSGANLHPLAVGLIAACCASLFHIFVDVDWLFSSIPVFFWIQAGLVLAISEYLPTQLESPPDFSSKYPPEKSKLILRYFLSYLIIIIGMVLCLPYTAERIAAKGVFFEKQHQLKKAINSYKLAGKIDPLNPEYPKKVAILYFKQTPGDKVISLDEALSQMKKATKLDSHRASNKIWRAKLYWEKQDKLQYLRNLEEAIKLEGINNPSYYNSAALYYLAQKNPERAKRYYLEIINLYPESYFKDMWYFRRDHIKKQLAESCIGLGTIYINEKNFSEAIKYLEKAVRLSSQNATAHFILGIAYFSDKKQKLAILSFKEVVKLDKNMSLAYYYIGLSYDNLKQYQKARKYFKKYEQLEKEARNKEK